MGNSPFPTIKATTERKEAEILVRGQSKHKWKWKFRERERNITWFVSEPKKSNQKYSNLLLSVSLSVYDKPTHNPYQKTKTKNQTDQVKWKTSRL